MPGKRDQSQSRGAAALRSGANLTRFRAIVESISAGGGELVGQVSALIEQAQVFVAAQVNAILALRNWYIGRMIDVEVLREVRADYAEEIVATLSQQLSWSHFNALLPVRTPKERALYIDRAVNARLSVRALRDLNGRQGFERKEVANTQIPGGSTVLVDSFRDPYLLAFLVFKEAYAERDLEEAIVRDMESFLLEAGNGWGFVARQKRMLVLDDDFYFDLLFYSRPLTPLIAAKLKLGRFEARYKAPMELYLKWLKRYERLEGEEAPIGLIMCTETIPEQIELLEMHKDGIVVAEYWMNLPPEEALQARIQAVYREAQERIVRRQLTTAAGEDIDEY